MNIELFENELQQAQSSAQTLAMVAFCIWIGYLVIAVGVCVWLYRDAEERGKNGVGAAMIGGGSAFIGWPALVVAIGSWILLRPNKRPQSQDTQPTSIPDDLQAAPSSEEFLQELERES